MANIPRPPRERWQVHALHNENGTSDKVYIVYVDEIPGDKPYYVRAAADAANAPMFRIYPKGQFKTIGEAQRVMVQLQLEKGKKGYIDIESHSYSGRLTLEQLLTGGKFDTSRLLGFGENQTSVCDPSKMVVVPEPLPLPLKAQAGFGRARRSIG